MDPMSEHPAHPNRIAVLRALADPVRLAVVDELALEDVCACVLRARLKLSAPLLSHHLKVLREAGLVRTRKAGRRLEVGSTAMRSPVSPGRSSRERAA